MFTVGRICAAVMLAGLILPAAGCQRRAETQDQRRSESQGPQRAQSEPQRQQPGGKTMSLTSTAFADGEPIPRKYTADGEDVSPPLSWTDVPEAARQFALIVDDPDAPRAEPWVHWILYGIAGEVRSLPEGTGRKDRQAQNLLEGENSWGKMGWGGPSPPRGHGTHRYFFKLYALDARLELKAGLTKQQLLQVIEGHVLDKCELVGTYQRS